MAKIKRVAAIWEQRQVYPAAFIQNILRSADASRGSKEQASPEPTPPPMDESTLTNIPKQKEIQEIPTIVCTEESHNELINLLVQSKESGKQDLGIY